MASGPLLSSDSFTTLTTSGSAYREPDAYQKLLPYALDDVCIEFSRYTTLDKLYGNNAIANMMLNVLYTRIGERDFEPEFGSNVISLLFEPNDPGPINYTLVELEVFDRVRRWVPYIDLAVAGIILQAVQPQMFRIGIVYTERATGIQQTFTAFLTRRGSIQ